MIKQKAKELAFEFNVRVPDLEDDMLLSYRAFPHKIYPVIRKVEKKYELIEMNYSLIPAWSKVRKPKFATYNARVETIAEKPTWREPLVKKHCLVPLNAFYESCYEGSHAGNVVMFFQPSEEPLYAAGLYEEWTDKESGELVESFAIVTKGPSKYIKSVGHDRSPIFLESNSWEEWLECEKRPSADWAQFLKRPPTTQIWMSPSSALLKPVGRAANSFLTQIETSPSNNSLPPYPNGGTLSENQSLHFRN